MDDSTYMIVPDRTDRRALGLSARDTVLQLLAGQAVQEGIAKLSDSTGCFALEALLDSRISAAIYDDLSIDPGWKEEHWILTEDGEVKPVDLSTFVATNPEQRFSRSDCLRHPASTSWCLRGFLSAVVSPAVKESLSKALGTPVDFASVEIARYRNGHYLRRHSDTFEDRCLGLVWFFSDFWRPGEGGELVADSRSGEAVCVPPVAGTVACIPIRPGNYHQVALVRSQTWIRYSIATHYRVASGTSQSANSIHV